MKINLVLRMGNAACEGPDCGSEVARILHALAGRVEEWHADNFRIAEPIVLRDVNGNTVGECVVTK